MDIQFKILELNDIIAMKPYFEACKLHLSDYSAAFKFMWQKHFTIKFAYICNCVVFREEFQGRTYFHYPMELNNGDALKALDELECYCRRNFIRIHFTCVPRDALMDLVCRYGMELRITNHRRWKDYFYLANDFVLYAGKKFSGQRNHVNKFKKLYPDYKFVELSQSDSGEMVQFLNEFSVRQLAKGTVMAKEELESVYDLLPHITELGLLVGAIKINNKIIALSIGERCGDQLIIHVEKALTEYEGLYPTMAQEFAKHFVTGNVLYINREDDAGDAGLRKSKLQYNPIYLVDKYDLSPRRVIDRLTHAPVIHTERLLIKEMTESDAPTLYKLEMDEERCKLWGYNWRDYLKEEPTPEQFLESTREDFKNREEMPMGIYVNGAMVGEVVLHNFGYRNDCEVGMRLLPEYEGNGYAAEAVLAVMNYALYELNMETILAKCQKGNVKSKQTLTSVGLRQYKEDEIYYYFRKTAAM
jgi:hypothetical protein